MRVLLLQVNITDGSQLKENWFLLSMNLTKLTDDEGQICYVNIVVIKWHNGVSHLIKECWFPLLFSSEKLFEVLFIFFFKKAKQIKVPMSII